MVKIQHTGENIDKIDLIISTAQHRFGLFGLEKTTMREIANDLGTSKASLYYYFPDKVSLFHAVIRKEQEDFFRYLDESRRKLVNPDDMLREYINIRNVYFRKFINLSKLRFNAIRELRPVMLDLIDALKEKELDFIRNIFVLGSEKEVYRQIDDEMVAGIFLESLQAIRRTYMGRTEFSGLESIDIESMEKKMSVFLNIFIHGIAGNRDSGSGENNNK